MKIKKFIAPDVRTAMKMVRDEQGPDAVIISNTRVAKGVEIIAAVEYDAALLSQWDNPSDEVTSSPEGRGEDYIADPESSNTDCSYIHVNQADHDLSTKTTGPSDSRDKALLSEMHEELKYLRNIVEKRFFDLEWANYSMSNPINAQIIKGLVNSGLSSNLAREIAGELPCSDKLEDALDAALVKLGNRLPVTSMDIADQGGVIALVGPTGVGKTTTIAKLAARYALRRGVRHVALISTDNYRVGAHEQLRTYGRLLDIPVRNVLNKADLGPQLEDLLDKDLVLIDTAGMSQRDMRMSEQLSVLKESRADIKVYLVVAATSQLAGLEETINAFRSIDLDGSIITKLDETTSIGPAISAMIEKRLPLAYVSDGQRVPEDLHLARVDKLINQGNFNMDKGKESSVEELMRFSMRRTITNAH